MYEIVQDNFAEEEVMKPLLQGSIELMDGINSLMVNKKKFDDIMFPIRKFKNSAKIMLSNDDFIDLYDEIEE